MALQAISVQREHTAIPVQAPGHELTQWIYNSRDSVVRRT